MVRCVQERKEELRIAKACHMHPTSGHMGVKKTVARIKERFAWKGIIKDVQRLVSVRQHFTCIYHSSRCTARWCNYYRKPFTKTVASARLISASLYKLWYKSAVLWFWHLPHLYAEGKTQLKWTINSTCSAVICSTASKNKRSLFSPDQQGKER